MIARIWRGATKADRAQDYLEYLRGTGLADYAATPGNHGAGRARLKAQPPKRERSACTLFT